MSTAPGGPLPRHPYTTASVLLGVLGLIPCFAPLAVWAWIWGNRGVAVVDEAPHRWTGRQRAVVGRTLGMVGTVLFIFWLVLMGFAYLVLR